MYCKRVGSTGPVFLYVPVKQKNKDFVRCNVDGSDWGVAPAAVVEPEAAPKEKVKRVKKTKVAAVEDYVSGDDLQIVDETEDEQ